MAAVREELRVQEILPQCCATAQSSSDERQTQASWQLQEDIGELQDKCLDLQNGLNHLRVESSEMLQEMHRLKLELSQLVAGMAQLKMHNICHDVDASVKKQWQVQEKLPLEMERMRVEVVQLKSCARGESSEEMQQSVMGMEGLSQHEAVATEPLLSFCMQKYVQEKLERLEQLKAEYNAVLTHLQHQDQEMRQVKLETAQLSMEVTQLKEWYQEQKLVEQLRAAVSSQVLQHFQSQGQEIQQLRNETAKLRNETAKLRIETAELRNETAKLRNETAKLRNAMAKLSMEVTQLKMHNICHDVDASVKKQWQVQEKLPLEMERMRVEVVQLKYNAALTHLQHRDQEMKLKTAQLSMEVTQLKPLSLCFPFHMQERNQELEKLVEQLRAAENRDRKHHLESNNEKGCQLEAMQLEIEQLRVEMAQLREENHHTTEKELEQLRRKNLCTKQCLEMATERIQKLEKQLAKPRRHQEKQSLAEEIENSRQNRSLAELGLDSSQNHSVDEDRESGTENHSQAEVGLNVSQNHSQAESRLLKRTGYFLCYFFSIIFFSIFSLMVYAKILS
ncbi:golgin subfamily A member 6-like protein 7 [Colius striatus]|uniref:golgin subfamily A member 6-like protein 7 n=1 Tax=Colius striatus TaxID=57412 RepID=UPI002B1CEE3E|nr:golgin subfamily A member 6-like protein 7 [Colius striatus]